jgi:hypothetical protein
MRLSGAIRPMKKIGRMACQRLGPGVAVLVCWADQDWRSCATSAAERLPVSAWLARNWMTGLVAVLRALISAGESMAMAMAATAKRTHARLCWGAFMPANRLCVRLLLIVP